MDSQQWTLLHSRTSAARRRRSRRNAAIHHRPVKRRLLARPRLPGLGAEVQRQLSGRTQRRACVAKRGECKSRSARTSRESNLDQIASSCRGWPRCQQSKSRRHGRRSNCRLTHSIGRWWNSMPASARSSSRQILSPRPSLPQSSRPHRPIPLRPIPLPQTAARRVLRRLHRRPDPAATPN
jgi:hypothetical protein